MTGRRHIARTDALIAIAVALGVTLAGAVPAVAADPDWTRRYVR